MKKVSVIFISLLLACGAIFANGAKDNGKIKIGVIQLVEHAALDASYKGFVDALAEAGYVDGQNISIDYQNAQGEQANCNTIAQKFVNGRSDLILAIATPAAQAVANLTKNIPILITAVTDPESAQLVKSNSKPGTNVSGTSDLTPCAAQMQLLKKVLPKAKTVGMLYCSSEQNSYFQISLAKKECDNLGLKYVDYTVSNPNEIQQVVQSMVGKVDAIYAPTDNMIAAGMVTVAQVATPAKLPVICGEEGMVDAGGFITYGIDYYALGRQTGAMAIDILKNGAKPENMPIQYLAGGNLKVNEKTRAALGITLPADLK